MPVGNFQLRPKRTWTIISCNFLEIHDIIYSKPSILYASGGIYARAIFFANAKNAHAQLYHEISSKFMI